MLKVGDNCVIDKGEFIYSKARITKITYGKLKGITYISSITCMVYPYNGTAFLGQVHPKNLAKIEYITK